MRHCIKIMLPDGRQIDVHETYLASILAPNSAQPFSSTKLPNTTQSRKSVGFTDPTYIYENNPLPSQTSSPRNYQSREGGGGISHFNTASFAHNQIFHRTKDVGEIVRK